MFAGCVRYVRLSVNEHKITARKYTQFHYALSNRGCREGTKHNVRLSGERGQFFSSKEIPTPKSSKQCVYNIHTMQNKQCNSCQKLSWNILFALCRPMWPNTVNGRHQSDQQFTRALKRGRERERYKAGKEGGTKSNAVGLTCKGDSTKNDQTQRLFEYLEHTLGFIWKFHSREIV